jgi:hypothetical protein
MAGFTPPDQGLLMAANEVLQSPQVVLKRSFFKFVF